MHFHFMRALEVTNEVQHLSESLVPELMIQPGARALAADFRLVAEN